MLSRFKIKPFSLVPKRVLFFKYNFTISEIVYAFAWEPNGHKFAFIHGESPRICVSFYAIRPGGKVDLLSKC